VSLDQATLDQATFWVALVAAVAAIATIVYGEISRRQQNSHHEEQRTLAEEQLQLAREQAEMRPDLKVFCAVRRSKSLEKGTLQVEVANSGKVAAHNVRGWIYFHKDFFGPPKLPSSPRERRAMDLSRAARSVGSHWGEIFDHTDVPDEAGWYTAHIFEKEEIVVGSRQTFSIPVTLKRTGKTLVRGRVVCNEGATFDDMLEVEVPPAPIDPGSPL
jgi:hypothetical protein